MLMYKHVSFYLPLQVFLEVFPEMQPELSEDSRKPEGYEEISGTKKREKLQVSEKREGDDMWDYIQKDFIVMQNMPPSCPSIERLNN